MDKERNGAIAKCTFYPISYKESYIHITKGMPTSFSIDSEYPKNPKQTGSELEFNNSLQCKNPCQRRINNQMLH